MQLQSRILELSVYAQIKHIYFLGQIIDFRLIGVNNARSVSSASDDR